jgi:hypothetical protein
MEAIMSLFMVEDRSVDDRNPISREAMQSAITVAVKKADPDCRSFVGVIVQRTNPKSCLETNWAIRGVKFGRANRSKASGAVNTIVERMQREFKLSSDCQVRFAEDED